MMTKLFLMDNDLKRLTSRIGTARSGVAKDNTVKVVFAKRAVPDEITDNIYGPNATRYKDYDPWGGGGLNQNRRAAYDAYVKIGNISCTITMQELVNLTERLSQIVQRQDLVLSQMSGNESL
jgi:hypothetical protein